jgi:hypothetical protein
MVLEIWKSWFLEIMVFGNHGIKMPRYRKSTLKRTGGAPRTSWL